MSRRPSRAQENGLSPGVARSGRPAPLRDDTAGTRPAACARATSRRRRRVRRQPGARAAQGRGTISGTRGACRHLVARARDRPRRAAVARASEEVEKDVEDRGGVETDGAPATAANTPCAAAQPGVGAGAGGASWSPRGRSPALKRPGRSPASRHRRLTPSPAAETAASGPSRTVRVAKAGAEAHDVFRTVACHEDARRRRSRRRRPR